VSGIAGSLYFPLADVADLVRAAMTTPSTVQPSTSGEQLAHSSPALWFVCDDDGAYVTANRWGRTASPAPEPGRRQVFAVGGGWRTLGDYDALRVGLRQICGTVPRYEVIPRTHLIEDHPSLGDLVGRGAAAGRRHLEFRFTDYTLRLACVDDAAPWSPPPIKIPKE
jgi:hypothetical protein